MKSKLMIIIGVMAAGIAAQAQYTWDITPGTVGSGDSAITVGDGTWDAITGNWTTDAGANNISWLSGADALFGTGTYTVTIENGFGAVTVGGLDIGAGNGNVTLKAALNNDGVTVSGSPTWDLNGNQLTFNNDQVLDTVFNMTAGQTLTVQSTGGGGTLDTGTAPLSAVYGVAGATLDFQAETLGGNTDSVGVFNTVKLADGSTYIHQRNQNQTYTNNWELTSGTGSFAVQYNRNATMQGVISGAGRLGVADNVGFDNTAVTLSSSNTFTGGVFVDGTGKLIIDADDRLGAVPGSFDADNITLSNGGVLQLTSTSLDSNRGITLDNGGAIIINSAASTYGGVITGTGGFQVGRSPSTSGNDITFTTAQDYEGDTLVYRGKIICGIENALPTNTVVRLAGKTGGGAGSQRYELNGFNQTLAGLETGGSGTREIYNTPATVVTQTLNVVQDAGAIYGGNIRGTTETIHIVKNGPEIQRFSKVPDGNTVDFAGATINEGRLRMRAPIINLSNITVNDTGQLVVDFDDADPAQWTESDIQTLLSVATFNAGSYLVFNNQPGETATYGNALDGVFGFGLAGFNGGTRILQAVNTYSGITFIEGTGGGNVLKLASGSTINSSPEIQLRGTNATWDVSAFVNYNLVAGQTLTGPGNVTGNVVAASSSVIRPSYTNELAGTMNISGDLDISAIAGADAGGLQFEFGTNWINSVDVGGTLIIGSSLLNYADFTFDDVNGMENGTYTLFSSTLLDGSLGAGLSGPVGTNGVSGTISISGNDIVLTVTGGTDYGPFGQWAAGYDLSGTNAMANANPDGDAYDNLQEYAFGGNPTNDADNGYVPSYGEVTQDGTNYFFYAYAYRTNSASGLTYELLSRPNLVSGGTWTNTGQTVLGTGEIDAEFASITNGVPLDPSDQYYFKLLITKE